jgi:integrase
MGAALDHVERDPKTSRLMYRRVYPLALRPFIPPPNSQLKRSLAATKIDAPGALERYREAADLYDRTVALARKAATRTFDRLDTPMIAFIAEAYRVERLTEDEDARWSPGSSTAFVVRRSHNGHLTRAVDTETRTTRDVTYWQALRALADLEGICSEWTDTAERLAAKNGYVFDTTEPAYRQLCRALNDAAILASGTILDRQTGAVLPTPADPQRPARLPEVIEAPREPALEETFEKIATALLDAAYQAISPTTRQGAQTALRFLREALGPVTPTALTRRAVTDMLHLLAQRPAKVPHAHRTASLQELAVLYANRPDVPRLSPVTLDRHVGALATLWTKAATAGDIPEEVPNPFKARTSPQGTKRPKVIGFSLAEIQAFLALPIFTHGERPVRGRGEASYWIPLMLLWTGARPEEIAQMLVADIAHDPDSGRWMMTITDAGVHPVKGQQSLKTSKKDSGVRTFPVPAPLIDLNFLDYVTWLKGSGTIALFPKLTIKNARNLLFPTFGEWWSKYVEEQGVKPAGEGRQPSREFRHSWSTAARKSLLPRDAREYLMGHRPRNATANEEYGETASLGLAIDQHRYAGLDVSGIRRWTPPSQSTRARA